MTRGRRPHIDRPVKKHLSFGESLAGQVDAALADPLRGGPTYGGWSGLISMLLNQWLDGKIQLPVEPYRADLSDLTKGSGETAEDRYRKELLP